MDKNKLGTYLSTTLEALALGKKHGARVSRGKVRDMVDLGDRLIISVTDRLSAFDRVLTTIPCKGQVLNELSLFWFEATRSIVQNHILEQLSPRSVVALKCDVLPVEVIVRAYLTGSAWRDYRQGKSIAGIVLPPDMRSNQKFESPILTPSTKAERGAHDEPIAAGEIVGRGLVSEALWRRVEECALALFKAGSEHAAERGLILVDTKYEFGVRGGELYLVDEVHTPDSSRFWYADSYADLYERGEAQRELDKEYLRRWLIERGYMGDGEAPRIPDDIRLETGLRYVTAFEKITGRAFAPGDVDARRETELIERAVEHLM